MNFFKLATSKEAMEIFNAARNTYNQITSRANPQRDKFPKELDKKQIKRIVTQHSDSWYTAEMKDGGFSFIYEPCNWIAFYSTQLSDIDVMKLFCDEFVEITMREDCIQIINKVVELIIANPDYDPMYYATAAGLDGYVGKRMMKTNMKILNQSLTKNAETAAHIAVQNNQKIIGMLLKQDMDFLKKTNDGKTIGHYASNHVEMLKIIQDTISDADFLKLMLTENNSMETAIHFAIKNEKSFDYVLKYCPQCFAKQFSLPLVSVIKDIENEKLAEKLCKTLIILDTEFFDRKINSNGDTILHTPISRNILNIILKNIHKNTIEAKDSNGRTPLHLAVLRGDIEQILAFISNGSNVNSSDSKNMTPICYAIEKNNICAVKSLLLFNANVQKIPNVGTASKEIQNAIRSGSQEYYSREPREYKFNENNIEHIALKRSIEVLKKKADLSEFFNAISFDGGGIRGLVSLQILREISNRYTKDNFLKSFKSLGGTSTGSILILAIAKYGDIEKVARLYLRMKDDIFFGSRPYCGERLEQKLIEELGDITLRELGLQTEKRLAITVTRCDISPPILAIFRSYEIPRNIDDERFSKLEDWTAAKIARCSSAAPTYFPSVEGKYMDGGIIANNPSCEILCDQQTISLLMPETKNQMKMILSIGTGKTPKKEAKHVDVSIPEKSISGWISSINSLVHIKNVFIDQLTSADGVNVDRARMMSSAMNVAFFRFSPQLSQEYELDEIRGERLVELMWETKMYMHTRLNDINILLDLL